MAQRKTILIVDDEKNTRDGLRDALEDHFEVYVAADIAGAEEILKTDPPDVLVTDLRLAGESGMDLIDSVVKKPGAPVCIMMTAYGSVDTAVRAMKHGAYDFVTKPVNIDHIEIMIRRALRERETQVEIKELKEQVRRDRSLDGMIGSSGVMVRIFDTIKQVAPSRATVLIQGESGTGKEVAAHAIHNLSPRADKRFVAVHCMALSPQLLESELFGHEKGAFTGATERRIGRFEQAAGGTLFLDEIGEIDPAVQVKILRVLGERTFERVGSNQTLQADVRLVAATNKDLAKLVSEGKFRDDLFFRLNVVPITMPPLRTRKEDIPLLVQTFLKEAARENDKPFREMTPEAMACIVSYDWPGNVRELRTAVEHGVVMCSTPRIGVRDLPHFVREAVPLVSQVALLQGSSPDETGNTVKADALNLHQTERALIFRALDESGGNRTEAAKRLGISRRTLHRRLKELSITKHP
jgi:DNA-binding NtrC family response regulator